MLGIQIIVPVYHAYIVVYFSVGGVDEAFCNQRYEIIAELFSYVLHTSYRLAVNCQVVCDK